MTIFQVVLFHDPTSVPLGPAVWAAFREVEAFFRRSNERSDYTFPRYYLAESVPEALKSEVTNSEGARRGLDQGFWKRADARGLYDETYEQEALVAEARRLIGPAVDGQPLVVVTDVVLSTLPKDFFERQEIPSSLNRYIMWNRVGDSFIISLAPMDPSYWDLKDERRDHTVKRRVRAAGCRCTCELLGVGACRTRGCFMHTPVLSAAKLDDMTHLCGDRHHDKAPDLQGYGFQGEGEDAALVQQPIAVKINQ